MYLVDAVVTTEVFHFNHSMRILKCFLIIKEYQVVIFDFTGMKQKDHICDVCGKGFSCNDYLKNHMVVHTSMLYFVVIFFISTSINIARFRE